MHEGSLINSEHEYNWSCVHYIYRYNIIVVETFLMIQTWKHSFSPDNSLQNAITFLHLVSLYKIPQRGACGPVYFRLTGSRRAGMSDKERLFEACERGEIDNVRKIVAKGTDPRRVRCDPAWGRNETPLHAACWWVCSVEDNHPYKLPYQWMGSCPVYGPNNRTLRHPSYPVMIGWMENGSV